MTPEQALATVQAPRISGIGALPAAVGALIVKVKTLIPKVVGFLKKIFGKIFGFLKKKQPAVNERDGSDLSLLEPDAAPTPTYTGQPVRRQAPADNRVSRSGYDATDRASLVATGQSNSPALPLLMGIGGALALLKFS